MDGTQPVETEPKLESNFILLQGSTAAVPLAAVGRLCKNKVRRALPRSGGHRPEAPKRTLPPRQWYT
jgi:hypothetical protein